MMPDMPKFETEAEEAEWWYTQRHKLADEFLTGQPKLVEAGSIARLRERRAAASSSHSGDTPVPKLPRSA